MFIPIDTSKVIQQPAIFGRFSLMNKPPSVVTVKSVKMIQIIRMISALNRCHTTFVG